MLSKGLFTASQNPANLDQIILKKNNVVVGKKPISIAAVRDYLVGTGSAQYTLNATLRIARFVAKEMGITFTVPTNLSGTEADNVLFVPDDIALGIVLLQAHNGLTVDGIPGADFIRKVMGLHKTMLVAAHCRAAFMDESENKNNLTPDGKPIVLPNFFTEDEAVAYNFLRNITLARNGVWSDKPNIVNFAALRMERGSTDIQWDDTIGVCWINAEGHKSAKIYTATTEPGNRKLFKTLLSQTIIFVPGYHQGKLPAMRGHRLVVSDPTIKFPDRLLFTSNDARGLNLHPGGSTGSMKNLVKYIFPVGAETESEFRAVLVIMEMFEILSHWGLDPARPAWDNLADWAAKKALKTSKIKGGFVPVLQDESVAPVKQISIAKARAWLANKWSDNRPILFKILRSVDRLFTLPPNFNALNTKGLEQIITDQHIEGIVRRQCQTFLDLKQVDGLAGNTYLNLMNAEIPADGSLAQQANADFARMNILFAQFSGSNAVLTTARKNYIKQIKTQTLVERAKLRDAEEKKTLEVSGQHIQEAVGQWSILCQVVFGPEMFYEMMDFALANCLQTGQRRWYYTLIDQATIPQKV